MHFRGWCAAATAVICALTPLSARAQQADSIFRINADRVNLRAAPSIDSTIIRGLEKGMLVTLLSRSGAWARVHAPSGAGWVRASQMEPAAAVAAAPRPVAPATPLDPATVPRLPVQSAPPPRASNGAHTRRPRPEGISGGIVLFGGASLANVAFNGTASGTGYGHRVGLAGGIGIHSGGHLGLALDVMYVQKGTGIGVGPDRATLSTAYTEGTAGVGYSSGRRVALLLNAGGFAAYEMSCTLSGGAVPGRCDGNREFDNHRKTDYGLTVQAGIRRAVLSATVRYDVGLRGLYTDGTHGGTTQSIMILLGVSI
jgi:hypothetical protein